MKTSKNLLRILTKVLMIGIIGIVLVGGIIFSILSGEATFDESYQSVIQRKYDLLENTTERKIIIVGGSNAGFGIDAKMLKEKTGYEVCNMGLHAGFGNLFNTEVVKENINEGDIVLLAYEYSLYQPCFDKLGDVQLIMSGIDNDLEMYRIIPLKDIPEILGNVIQYAKVKSKKEVSLGEVYSSDSFDEDGNMILKRENSTLSDYADNVEEYGQISTEMLCLHQDNIEYLYELKQLVEEANAQIYFVAPPLLDEAYTGTESDLEQYREELESETGIQYISNPYEYLFDSEYMFNTIYHCNEKGEEKRTELLINDLVKCGVITDE